jgi:predicted ATPase
VNIQVLVTSRTRLNVQTEQIFPLEGLRYPEPDSLNGAPVDLEDYSALQLFHSAARLVRPDYTHSSDDLPHLARICQLVDGMPLGLVLAAGWLETCTPAEIAVEIEHCWTFCPPAGMTSPSASVPCALPSTTPGIY